MNRFQPFDFRNINEFMDFLPDDQLAITEKLREIIKECIPDVKEKLSYNVPFYSRYTRICFIWPGAVPWGKISSGVQIGFCKGYLLSDVSWLDIGNRKQVYTRTFHSLKDINGDQLRSSLWEAMLIDEENFRLKKNR